MNVSSNQHVHVLLSCHYRLSCRSSFRSPKWPFLGRFSLKSTCRAYIFNLIGLIFGYVVALVVLYRSCEFQFPTSFIVHHTTYILQKTRFLLVQKVVFGKHGRILLKFCTHVGLTVRLTNPVGFYEKSTIRLKICVDNCHF